MFPGIKIYIYPNCFLSYLINYTISYFYVYYPSYMDWLRTNWLRYSNLTKIQSSSFLRSNYTVWNTGWYYHI